jgi:hypothetical protein
MATASRLPRESDDIEVTQLSRAEYDQAVAAALREVGLTYRQLASQARTGRFSSINARKLWLAIGNASGAC